MEQKIFKIRNFFTSFLHKPFLILSKLMEDIVI